MTLSRVGLPEFRQIILERDDIHERLATVRRILDNRRIHAGRTKHKPRRVAVKDRSAIKAARKANVQRRKGRP